MDETENKIETYSLDMFSNIKEAKFEKPKFEKATEVTIVGMPEIHSNNEDKVGRTKKDNKEFLKFYFTVKFKSEDGNEFRESYGFQVFDEAGKKIVYYGKDTAAREFVNIVIQYVPEVTAESSIGDILKAIADKKVKVITKGYGVSVKSPKTQILSFV
jgi:hypothetical protein